MLRMTVDQIPAFIEGIIALGCDVQAATPMHYVICDSDLPPKVYESIRNDLNTLCDSYGERDHLRYEIVAYLYSIGRVYQFNPHEMAAYSD